MERVFKQNAHCSGCSSWIVAIQSLSGGSRCSAWRTCQHQPLTDPSTSCTTYVIMKIMFKYPKRVYTADELEETWFGSTEFGRLRAWGRWLLALSPLCWTPIGSGFTSTQVFHRTMEEKQTCAAIRRSFWSTAFFFVVRRLRYRKFRKNEIEAAEYRGFGILSVHA